ncbi:MAG: V-type ATPase subunit [Clostridiales bacterium]|jgi:V/A-type H+-transporting ATPase subunit C|nr:V-type ATPase subunit [Clostridiales bacterium]
MSRPSRLEYAYAVGRVHALENYLIHQAVFREAAEATDFVSALKIVYDAGNYGEDLIKVSNSKELDAVLFREEENLKNLVGAILLEKDILKVMLLDESPEEALAPAERSGNAFILGYVKCRIDTGNIKIFCRSMYLEIPEEKFEKLFLPGGTIAPQDFVGCYGLALHEACDRFQATAYHDLWKRGVDVFLERQTFVELERRIEDFLMSYLRRAKHITFGPEPVFAYGLAKKRELALVRLLGLGKMMKLPAELIKERISATYV